jgi:type I restriction enzyme, S subunit
VTPEATARQIIDQRLQLAGWIVQDMKALNLGAGRGVVVREYPTDTGPADYVLFVDRTPVGVIEAKRDEAGENITVTEGQTERYAAAALKWRKDDTPLPFLFEATGQIIRFTDGRDPAPRSRFHFFRPDTLAKWLSQPSTLRRRLAERMPELPTQNLRDCQIGYTAIAAQPVTTNQGFKSFIPAEGVVSDYVYHWLSSAKSMAEGLASGTTFLELSGAKAAHIPIPVAPAAEQTRIVAKLEELLSGLDAGVVELKTAQKKLAQYRQSLLKAAVEGALTADWRAARRAAEPLTLDPAGIREASPRYTARADSPAPETETGAELLARILTERRARWEAKQLARFKEQGKTPPKGWQSKYPEPVAPDTRNLPALPEGWVWATIGQCFRVAVGATPSRQQPGYWAGDIPWVSSGEVRFSRIKETKERITPEGLANSSTVINPKGSVLLGMIGEGKTRGQVSILDIEAANNQNCAAIWVSESDIPPEFVYFWLWSRYEETRRGSSGNNQPALNKSIVESIQIPLPPLDEMKIIAEVLQRRFEQLDEMHAAVEMSLKQSAAQRQNILRAAFAGQLVPQDPDDEPAEKLLERIRAERLVRGAARPARRRASGTRETA